MIDQYSMWLFTMVCGVTGESQSVMTCDRCAQEMPVIDGDAVRATDANPEIECEFCDKAWLT